MMADYSTPSCPFCPFTDQDADFVTQHIDFCHPEFGGAGFLSDSPPVASPRFSPSVGDDADKYVDCPHGCGETVTSAELSNHLDLHVAEGMALDDAGATPAHSNVGASYEDDRSFDEDDSFDMLNSHNGGKRGMQRDVSRANTAKPQRPHDPPKTIGPDGAKRLGVRITYWYSTTQSLILSQRSELGPHAHEKKMPWWLRTMLEKGGRTSKQTQITSDGKLSRRETVENETDNLIPILARLCEQDKSVKRAFFCSPKVRHICKLSREGGFCGYRNIQMLISYLKKSRSYGHEHFPEKGPTILDLQDMIESAWDMGFNSVGRTETGGIKGTRKFIGTPEVGFFSHI